MQKMFLVLLVASLVAGLAFSQTRSRKRIIYPPEFRPDLPKTMVGKVLRRALREGG